MKMLQQLYWPIAAIPVSAWPLCCSYRFVSEASLGDLFARSMNHDSGTTLLFPHV